MSTCENTLCDSEAEYLDSMDNKVCGCCMDDEITMSNGEVTPEDFESITQK